MMAFSADYYEAEISDLREEIEKLDAENAELRQEVRDCHAERVEIAPGLECTCKWCKGEN